MHLKSVVTTGSLLEVVEDTLHLMGAMTSLHSIIVFAAFLCLFSPYFGMLGGGGDGSVLYSSPIPSPSFPVY
jgi:hypothetical protein